MFDAVETLESYAQRKGVKAEFKIENKKYVMYVDGEKVFESPRLEDVAVHIDILALDKLFD